MFLFPRLVRTSMFLRPLLCSSHVDLSWNSVQNVAKIGPCRWRPIFYSDLLKLCVKMLQKSVLAVDAQNFYSDFLKFCAKMLQNRSLPLTPKILLFEILCKNVANSGSNMRFEKFSIPFSFFHFSIFFLFGGSFASLIMMFENIRITIFFSNSGWG